MNINKSESAGHLCNHIQPDGRMQRCIRFEGHEGPHHTFVAEWNTGELESRRRQQRSVCPTTPANARQNGNRARTTPPPHIARRAESRAARF
jgi:hypothetical protein